MLIHFNRICGVKLLAPSAFCHIVKVRSSSWHVLWNYAISAFYRSEACTNKIQEQSSNLHHWITSNPSRQKIQSSGTSRISRSTFFCYTFTRVLLLSDHGLLKIRPYKHNFHGEHSRPLVYFCSAAVFIARGGVRIGPGAVHEVWGSTDVALT